MRWKLRRWFFGQPPSCGCGGGHLVPPWAHLVFLAVYSVGSVCIYFYRVIRRIEGKPTTSDDIESIVDCDDGVFCKGRPERNGR